MTMEYGESRLRQLGDADLAEMQATLHRIFRQRHPDMEDIALPSQVSPLEQASAPVEEATAQAERPVPNFYILRQVEGLVIPSADQLVVTARKELKEKMFRDVEVPEPSADLFETLRGFAERGITKFDEIHYFPQMQLKEDDKLWKERGRVKPGSNFWQQIKEGNFPQHVTELDEGWYIFDRRAKPMYANGQQRYSGDDYMEPLMAHLRATNRIERYSPVPDTSRAGASPREIEGVILPAFAEMSGAKGIVGNRRYIEFNVLGNIAHPELGQTNTWEWFGDPAFRGDSRLIGGFSDGGGLADVDDDHVGFRFDFTAFSPVVRFPSKAA